MNLCHDHKNVPGSLLENEKHVGQGQAIPVILVTAMLIPRNINEPSQDQHSCISDNQHIKILINCKPKF